MVHHSWGHRSLGPRGTAAPTPGSPSLFPRSATGSREAGAAAGLRALPFGWEMPLVAECNDSSTSRAAQTQVIRTVCPEGFFRANARHECEGSPSWSWDPSILSGWYHEAGGKGNGGDRS